MHSELSLFPSQCGVHGIRLIPINFGGMVVTLLLYSAENVFAALSQSQHHVYRSAG